MIVRRNKENNKYKIKYILIISIIYFYQGEIK